MKWEKVKKRVADEVYTAILHQQHNYEASAACLLDAVAERRTFKESAADLAFRCHRIIMEWDVRAAPRLRELFTDKFPKSLRRGRIGAYMEDSAQSPWRLYIMDMAVV